MLTLTCNDIVVLKYSQVSKFQNVIKYQFCNIKLLLGTYPFEIILGSMTTIYLMPKFF